MDLEAIFNVRNFFPPIENSFWMRIKRIWTGNRVYNSSYYYSVVSFNMKVRVHRGFATPDYLLIWISGWRKNTSSFIVTGNKVNFRPNMAPPFLEYWKFIHFTFPEDRFCFESRKGYQWSFFIEYCIRNTCSQFKTKLRTWNWKLLKISKWKKMH